MERLACCLCVMLLCVLSSIAVAQPEDFKGVVAGERPEVIFVVGRPTARPAKLSPKAKVVPLEDLQFTGPQPSHPFVLGNFAHDGEWGIVEGHIQLLDGRNAALQLAWADQFELEGIMEQAGFGGWFFLLGWDQGRGYALSNVTMKESGSPWFLSEFRGNKAIDGRTKEFDKFEWKHAQPFVLRVEKNKLSLKVGAFQVFNQEPLDGYSPGRIVFGVYDTRYGPRPARIRSLKIRALKSPGAADPGTDVDLDDEDLLTE